MKHILILALLSTFAFAEPKILFEEDPSALVTTIHVALLAGSEDDPRGKAGTMSMVTQMLLRGTKKMSREKFQSEIEGMGATLSASVTHDGAYLTGRVIKENTIPFIRFLREALLTPAFSQKEFDNLKQEYLDGIQAIKNSNGALSSLAARKEIFAGSSLETADSGNLKSVQAIKLEDINRMYNDNIHRANMLFAASSPLKENVLKDAFTEIWMQLPDGARLSHKNIVPQLPTSPKIILVHKGQTSTGSMTFGQKGITAQDPYRFALEVSDFSFGAEPLVSKLFRVVRAELGYTYSIRSRYTGMVPLSSQMGVYTIATTPSVEFTSKTLFKVLSLWREYLRNGLASDDVSLAKESLINSYPFEFENATKRLAKKLHSYLYNVPILTPEEYAQKISEITNSKIIEALSKKQTPLGWVIAIVADEKVFPKQLEEAQKDVPEAKRLKISKTLTPEQVIE